MVQIEMSLAYTANRLRQPLFLNSSKKSIDIQSRKSIFISLKCICNPCDKYEFIAEGECAPLELFSQESIKDAQNVINKIKDDFIIYLQEDISAWYSGQISIRKLIDRFIERNSGINNYSIRVPPSVSIALEVAFLKLIQEISFVKGKYLFKLDSGTFLANILECEYKEVFPSTELISTVHALHELKNHTKLYTSTYKIKVGNDSQISSTDLNLAVEHLPKFVRIRLDANCQWNFTQAINFISALDNEVLSRIDWVEDPLLENADFGELEELSSSCGIGYAIDEIYRSQREQYSQEILRTSKYLKAIILKPMLEGSLLNILYFAQNNPELSVILSSCYESSYSLEFYDKFSHLLPKIQAHGLGTHDIFL